MVARTTYTQSERRALLALRARYEVASDRFSKGELAQLHSLRWLYRTGPRAPRRAKAPESVQQGATSMITRRKLETFGQSAASNTRWSAMARDIASHIGDGKPAPFAGFVWYRCEDPYQRLFREVEAVLQHVGNATVDSPR